MQTYKDKIWGVGNARKCCRIAETTKGYHVFRGANLDSISGVAVILSDAAYYKNCVLSDKVIRGYGGIGRHAGFRYLCGMRMGSSPIIRTKPI